MKLRKIVPMMMAFVMVFSLMTAMTAGSRPVKAAEKPTISFGYVAWPGVTVKTHVMKNIAEYLGYEVEITMGMKALVFKGMEAGDVDVFLELWLPQMKNDFKPYQEEGTIKIVRANVEELVWKTAVPEYVWEAGVKSHADLNEYAEEFDYKWYGLEAGSSGNAIIQDAIENNTYNLGEWEVVTSGEAAMLSSVKRHVNNKEWIAFSAWKPHWMNSMFDLKYLEDPEHIWGDPDEEKAVYTTVRSGFEEERPNFYKMLEQFKINAPIQSQWILEYGQKDRPADEVAKEWIANNQEIVNQWLFGVKSVDGRMARKVIDEKLSE